jgi:hypothetical protein
LRGSRDASSAHGLSLSLSTVALPPSDFRGTPRQQALQRRAQQRALAFNLVTPLSAMSLVSMTLGRGRTSAMNRGTMPGAAGGAPRGPDAGGRPGPGFAWPAPVLVALAAAAKEALVAQQAVQAVPTGPATALAPHPPQAASTRAGSSAAPSHAPSHAPSQYMRLGPLASEVGLEPHLASGELAAAASAAAAAAAAQHAHAAAGGVHASASEATSHAADADSHPPPTPPLPLEVDAWAAAADPAAGGPPGTAEPGDAPTRRLTSPDPSFEPPPESLDPTTAAIAALAAEHALPPPHALAAPRQPGAGRTARRRSLALLEQVLLHVLNLDSLKALLSP